MTRLTTCSQVVSPVQVVLGGVAVRPVAFVAGACTATTVEGSVSAVDVGATGADAVELSPAGMRTSFHDRSGWPAIATPAPKPQTKVVGTTSDDRFTVETLPTQGRATLPTGER
jgi:hypothetical protein